MNQHCYLEILARLCEAVCQRRPDAWILHRDYAPAHDVLAVQDFLGRKFILTLNHPPYLRDLAMWHIWQFPELKTSLKGHIFRHC
jgi:hypothetical protein